MKNYNQFLEGIRWYQDGKFLPEDEPEDEPKDQIGKYVDFIENDKFRQFLIERGAYESFIKNFYKQLNKSESEMVSSFNKMDETGYIDRAFIWSKTDELFDYWNQLSFDWKNFILKK